MNVTIEVAFYLCAVYLIIGCIIQANIINPSARPSLKACVWVIMVGATMQILAGAWQLLTSAAMVVSCISSLGVGSFFLFGNKRGKKVHHHAHAHHNGS